MKELVEYIRMHKVGALPMTRGEYNDFRGWKTPENENPSDEGYLVRYPDGYESWCPKRQFEEAARPVDGMTFGMAVEAMKRGAKVARGGWNGKGMWLWLAQGYELSLDGKGNPRLMCAAEHDIAEETGGTVDVAPVVCMFTAQKIEQPGWLASQTDILAEDWTVVE